MSKNPKKINADDVPVTIPRDKLAPQVIRPSQNVIKKYDFKVGFSFGFFAFLISPIILFQSVLLFLFLLTSQTTSGDAPISLEPGSFLMMTVKMLFYSILLFIAINLVISFLGVLFDRRRLFAVIALVITTVSLVFVFLGPRLSDTSLGVFGIF